MQVNNYTSDANEMANTLIAMAFAVVGAHLAPQFLNLNFLAIHFSDFSINQKTVHFLWQCFSSVVFSALGISTKLLIEYIIGKYKNKHTPQ